MKETEFLLPYDSHASDFGSTKLGELIGDAVRIKLDADRKVKLEAL